MCVRERVLGGEKAQLGETGEKKKNSFDPLALTSAGAARARAHAARKLSISSSRAAAANGRKSARDFSKALRGYRALRITGITMNAVTFILVLAMGICGENLEGPTGNGRFIIHTDFVTQLTSGAVLRSA